jgi:hypothetical protein
VDRAGIPAEKLADAAAVVVQSPNFFGVLEDVAWLAAEAHRHEALLITAIAEAMSLGIVRPPAEADIVAMEGQSFGIAPSYGRDRNERKVRAASAGTAGGADDGRGRAARVCTDASDARAAHPEGEGNFEYLHE